MLKFKVMKVTLETMKEGTYEFGADGVVTEKMLGKPYKALFNEETLRRLAFRLVSLHKNLASQNRLKAPEDHLIIEFPKTNEIFHPLNGLSRVKFPLSDDEIVEFWRYMRMERDRDGDGCAT